EQLVTSRMGQWLVDPGSIYQATRLSDPSMQRRLIARAAEIGKTWPESSDVEDVRLTGMVQCDIGDAVAFFVIDGQVDLPFPLLPALLKWNSLTVPRPHTHRSEVARPVSR
ncbi:MAG TPA: hypothetical protein VHY59_03535, partial [Chthoniobacterales bacterium]|nr:hypothetical protein [Chthoniobacterales bacterium]